MSHPRFGRLLVGMTVLCLVFVACARQGGATDAADDRAPARAPAPVPRAIRARAPSPARARPSTSPSTRGSATRPTRRWSRYILENELGYTVEKKNLAEQVSWEGFPTGDVDVILENWGHEDLKAKYIDTDKTAQAAGELGVTGIIGWYVPGLDEGGATRTSTTGTT